MFGVPHERLPGWGDGGTFFPQSLTDARPRTAGIFAATVGEFVRFAGTMLRVSSFSVASRRLVDCGDAGCRGGTTSATGTRAPLLSGVSSRPWGDLGLPSRACRVMDRGVVMGEDECLGTCCSKVVTRAATRERLHGDLLPLRDKVAEPAHLIASVFPDGGLRGPFDGVRGCLCAPAPLGREGVDMTLEIHLWAPRSPRHRAQPCAPNSKAEV